MSAYKRLLTKYTSRAMLRAALQAAGLKFEECAPGQEQHLIGYHDDVRDETATFIVRRQHIGSSSNDLGWRWDPEAKVFTEIVSEFDSTYRGTTKIRNQVRQEYAVAVATTQARAKGYQTKRLNLVDGQVQLVITGRL
jgi:hypothetical protein